MDVGVPELTAQETCKKQSTPGKITLTMGLRASSLINSTIVHTVVKMVFSDVFAEILIYIYIFFFIKYLCLLP